MLNILVNAYACSPDWGSEQGMAWNWVKSLSQYCNLHVITEGEYKEQIDRAVSELSHKEHLHFYYNPLPDQVRSMCWNQGDWRFYYYYEKWQRSTYLMALDIINTYPIDVVHQLNMIGFREPGYLWKIKKIPFVWGPVGGMENVPTAYLKGSDFRQFFFVYLKNLINTIQANYHPRVRKAVKRADALIAAVKGVEDKMHSYYHKESILINETGCLLPASGIDINYDKKQRKEIFDLLWVGKLDFRKQLSLAIATVANLRSLPGLRLHICGEGADMVKYQLLAKKLGVEDICIWHGKLPNKEIKQRMREADVFFFTSIMEATSTVVLEAIENRLPVVCFDTCGFGPVVDNTVGRKIKLSAPTQSVLDFSAVITELYENRELLCQLSKACVKKQEDLSWDHKARRVVRIYQQVIEKNGTD